MSELRQRKSGGVGDAGAELARVETQSLELEEHAGDLLEAQVKLSTRAWRALRRAGARGRILVGVVYRCLWYFCGRALLKLDWLASLFMGNQTEYVPAMDGNLGLLERGSIWLVQNKRRLSTGAALVVSVACALYVVLVMRSLLAERGHAFNPGAMQPASYLRVEDVPREFGCACRDLTGPELLSGLVYHSDPNSLASDGEGGAGWLDPGAKSAYASVAGVLAANAALLDAANDFGCLMAMPKIWNSSSPRDREFIDGAHRFNPCIATLDTQEHGRLELVNPGILNDDPVLQEGGGVVSLEKVLVKESLRVFDFLVDGIEQLRYRTVVLRYRTPPHLEIVRMVELTGVDAVIAQSALQVMRDGYADVVKKVSSASKRALRAEPHLADSPGRLKFAVTRAGVRYDYSLS